MLEAFRATVDDRKKVSMAVKGGGSGMIAEEAEAGGFECAGVDRPGGFSTEGSEGKWSCGRGGGGDEEKGRSGVSQKPGQKPSIAFLMPEFGGGIESSVTLSVPRGRAARWNGPVHHYLKLLWNKLLTQKECSPSQKFHIGPLSNCFSRRVRAHFSAAVRGPIP